MSKKYYYLIFLFFYPLLSQAQDIENAEDSAIYTGYHIIKKGETLYKLANSYDLGLDEILLANPDIIDAKSVYVGDKIILPTTHLIPDGLQDGIMINLAEPRLYFILGDNKGSFPISIGADEKTPVGKTKVIDKREHPSWTPPASIRKENPLLPEVVPPGPDNPLGNYALYLDASRHYKWQGVMIHGTNAPRSIGSRVSHGCIRLYPQDIQMLFNNVEIGTRVEIVNQPIKINQIDNRIYIEVHMRAAPYLIPENVDVNKLICKQISDCNNKIKWQKVDEAVAQNLGIPIEINN